MKAIRRIWVIRLLLAGATLAMLVTYVGAQGAAQAHGKELSIEITSFAPDPNDPLVRLYRVSVVFAGDKEPVEGANVQLSAVRQNGGPSLEPVTLKPLNEPGLYAAQLEFPLFGSWDVTLFVAEESEGQARYVEEIIPAAPSRASDEVRKQVLQLFLRFNWKDMAAIIVRVVHTVGSFVWFSMTGVILVAFIFLPPASRTPIFRKLSHVFMPATAISLTALLASGVYTAMFGAPIKAPGVFDFDTMMQIPFGPQYMGVIGFKMLALATSFVIVVRMAHALKIASYPTVAGGASLAIESGQSDIDVKIAAANREAPLLRLAIVNAVIGALMITAIVVAIYLHNISHLAVFVPQQ